VPRPSKSDAAIATASLNSKPIIVAGPTGVGKSAFAVELAIRFGGEVVGADAFQIYPGLEILTAQPTPDMLARVPHHLIGFLPPSEPFDAARFAALAREKIAEISARGRRPIITGGSGLYLKALLHGLSEMPPPDAALRAELSALSLEELQQRLEQADPQARELIDFQNPRRIARALEIHHLTGRSAARQREQWLGPPAFEFHGFLLTRDRAELDTRIAENVRSMFARGVIKEVAALGKVGPTASAAIGLREIQALLRAELTQPQCEEAITRATRRYAKRQLTWFRNQFTLRTINLTGLQHPHESFADTLLSLCELD
jgi:tRNA dimethylallyltransferase